MLNKDFREFIESLNSNGVRYLVLGGYALAFHGHPRYTKDLDIWLELSTPNAERTLAALADFGFSGLDLSTEDFMIKGMVVQLGYPPSRIGLINSPDGVEFEECWEKRIIVHLEGLAIPIIDIENFRKNKKESGRPQDLADLDAVSEK